MARGASPPKGITPKRNQPEYTEKMRAHKKGRRADMRNQFEGDVNETMKEGRNRYNLARNKKPKVKPPTKPRAKGK